MTDKTMNIYKSWVKTCYGIKVICENNGVLGYEPRFLDEFSDEEIEHLIWLLNEELRSRDEQAH